MRSKLWLLIGLTVLAAFAFSCTSGTTSTGGSAAVPAKNCDKVLAEIGQSKICLSDFQARLDKIPPFYRKRVATKNGKLEYLNRMVEDELFYLDALQNGVDRDPEVLDQLEQIKKSILAGKIKKDLMDEQVEVTDADVQKYYDDHKDEFMSPETVTVRHILFRVKHKATDDEKKEKEKKANEVYQQIKSGKISFEQAAKKFSEDKASAKKGGKLAPVKKGIKSAEFEKAAFGLSKKGDVSEVFQDRRGYNIVQFIEKTEPNLKEFDKVEARIKRKLQQEGRKEKMDSFTAKLRETNKVTINEDLLSDDEGTDAPAAPQGLPLLNKKGTQKTELKPEGK